MKKADFIIFVFIACIFFLFSFFNKTYVYDSSVVKVYVDKELIISKDISKDYYGKIDGVDNVSFYLKIKNGKVSVVDSSCPDKLCERSGKIYKNSESIICLPGKIVVCIESHKLPAYDAISR